MTGQARMALARARPPPGQDRGMRAGSISRPSRPCRFRSAFRPQAMIDNKRVELDVRMASAQGVQQGQRVPAAR